MELKGTFPLCQKLLYGKVELDDNEKTIAELAIPPGAVLNVLTFDQDVDDLDLDKFHSKFLPREHVFGLCVDVFCL